MYEVLGDAEKQEAIRQSNRERTHCYLLRKSAYSCASLPFDIDTSKAGCICPNNPYERFADKIMRQEARADLLQRAQDLYRATRTGTLSPDSPSVEITLSYTYADWLDNRRSEKNWQEKLLDS